ncbi:glycosyltransferase family 2 protein [Bosea vaviloviae]|uniref:Glycosyltransferase 2-like domain-containing protein n=1 Tax=Bosea vaviloviae TaxID=1526658 RepID=A0A0N0MBW8_9HYPH|nr:glycosyltransferase family 2 protein [Bosea vaviloviae]KPH81472.1 hypothetical protein AE618_06815 [Bosea vaviloviae]
MTIADSTERNPRQGDPLEQAVTLSVVLTAHNRRELTLSALRALRAAMPERVKASIFLTDDGSTDGTADAVRAEFPDAQIIVGDGNLYWNQGMLTAWKAAAAATQPDFFLWLNDDLAMNETALADMLACHAQAKAHHGEKVIIVGKTVSPSSGADTYGGFNVKEGLSRLHFRRLRSDETIAKTMNGNLVLLPARVQNDLGLLSENYRHTFGDIDYGLRATEAGYTIVQMGKPVGFQEYNEAQKRKLSKLTVANWRFILLHPKGVPWREWLYFCRRHGGPIWPLNFAVRYAKLIAANFR